MNYLKDGRLEIDNNRAERSIKPFVIGRKNFLFANTPRWAQGSTIIYNLLETAKEKHLDPFRYLVHILATAKKVDLSQKDSVNLLMQKNILAKYNVNFKK